MVYVVHQIGFWHQPSCSSTVMNSGMQGSDGLFNDGLELGTCKNNGLVCPSGHDNIYHAHHPIISHHRLRGRTIRSIHFLPEWHLSLTFLSFLTPE